MTIDIKYIPLRFYLAKVWSAYLIGLICKIYNNCYFKVFEKQNSVNMNMMMKFVQKNNNIILIEWDYWKKTDKI